MEPQCNWCHNPAELVTIPKNNLDATVNYLCSACFKTTYFPGNFAVPCTCIQITQGRVKIDVDKLNSQCSEVVKGLSTYQARVMEEAESVRSRYEQVFSTLIQRLTETQAKVMAEVNESEATEVQHVNVVIKDVESLLDNLTLNRAIVYLVTYFYKEDKLDFPRFMEVPGELEGYEAALMVPVPIIKKDNIKNAEQSESGPRQDSPRRLEEDTMLIMPIDTRNILITDLSGSVPQRKMIPCRPDFPFRVDARWCLVNDHSYAYTGGLLSGKPVNQCDFIDTSRVNDDQEIKRAGSAKMILPRHRHALICNGNAVYAFGGHFDESPGDGSGIEGLPLVDGDWTGSRWTPKGEMEEVPDLTATVLRDWIYLAGSSRAIYKFDTTNDILKKVPISRILEIQTTPNSPIDVGSYETGRLTNPNFPLPRQSSNTLIFAWETQVMLLQHEFLYYFTPGSKQTNMYRKKVGLVKPWCSPFPAVVSGSKCYFIMESTESDLTPAGEVWSFDFIQKTVRLLDLKAKSK